MTTEETVNADSIDDVERLLGSLELVAPTERLDAVIVELAKDKDAPGTGLVLQTEGAGRFGWPSLLATALAACMFGVLIGQYVSPVPATSFVAENSIPAEDSELTPVAFNVNAFNLMHGHSKKAEYSNCDACHQSKWEAFEGWFYGDANFFEVHRFEMEKPLTLANCFACHQFQIDDLLPINKANAHQFDGRDCRDCHKVGSTSFDLDSKG